MNTDLRVGESCQVKIGKKTYTGQIVSIGKYSYISNHTYMYNISCSVYMHMPIQLKFNMLYIGMETEMKDYEKKFEDGQWLPDDKVLEDAINRVVPVNTNAGTVCCVYISLFVYLGNE